MSLMVGFVRYGLELLGIQNKAENTVRPEPGQEESKAAEAENIVPANVREIFTKLVDAYYTRASNYLLKEHQVNFSLLLSRAQNLFLIRLFVPKSEKIAKLNRTKVS